LATIAFNLGVQPWIINEADLPTNIDMFVGDDIAFASIQVFDQNGDNMDFTANAEGLFIVSRNYEGVPSGDLVFRIKGDTGVGKMSFDAAANDFDLFLQPDHTELLDSRLNNPGLFKYAIIIDPDTSVVPISRRATVREGLILAKRRMSADDPNTVVANFP